jgi:head-tail adaptor
MGVFDISKLKHQLILEVSEYKKDGYGGYEVVWRQAQAIWASVFMLSVYKSDNRRSLGKQMQYKIVARNNAQLTHNTRLKYGEKNLAIISIAENSQDENFINILAQEDHDLSNASLQSHL